MSGSQCELRTQRTDSPDFFVKNLYISIMVSIMLYHIMRFDMSELGSRVLEVKVPIYSSQVPSNLRRCDLSDDYAQPDGQMRDHRMSFF